MSISNDSLMINSVLSQFTGSFNPILYSSAVPLAANQSTLDGATQTTASNTGCVNYTRPIQLYPSVYFSYKMIVDVYLVGVLCLFGFLGNFLSIAVLCRDREKQNTTNWLLQTLAVVDSFFLASSLFIQSVKTVHDMTDWWPTLLNAFPYIESPMWGLASIAQTMTVWLVMLITIDRYVAVCKPWHTKWRALRRIRLIVFVMFLLAVLYNVPRFLERKMLFSHHCRGGYVVQTVKTAFRGNRNYFLAYKTICYFIFRSIGPLVILVALNARLVHALQLVRRRHRDMTKKTKQRENITVMLVVVVTVFIICQLPDLGVRIAVTVMEFSPLIRVDIQAMRYANAASNALLTVNSSVNFLIYCLIGKKFRRIFVHMATCGLEGTKGSSGTGVGTGRRGDNGSCAAVTSRTCRHNGMGSTAEADVSYTEIMLATTHTTTMGHRVNGRACRLAVLLRMTEAGNTDTSSTAAEAVVL